MYLWVFVRSIKVKLYIHMYLSGYVRSKRVLNVKFFSKKIRRNETYTVLIFRYQAIEFIIFWDIIAREVVILFFSPWIKIVYKLLSYNVSAVKSHHSYLGVLPRVGVQYR